MGEGVGGVAIRAAQIASCEPDENARQAGEGAFALQAQIDFIDDERVGHDCSVARRREKEMRALIFRRERPVGMEFAEENLNYFMGFLPHCEKLEGG